MTRSQLELKQARCKISNKGYLSLNIWVIFCHSKYDLRQDLKLHGLSSQNPNNLLEKNPMPRKSHNV